MSWIISLVLAGMMLTSQNNFPIYSNDNLNYTNASQAVVTGPQIVMLDESERFEQTYPLNSNGRVSVSNVNGSITIQSWDRNEVKLEAVKTIDCDKPMKIEIKIDAAPNAIAVSTEYPKNQNTYINNGSKETKVWTNGYQNRCRRADVDYKLTVPRNAVLDEIEAVNGSITVSNMSNSTKISTVNGEIKATNLRGSSNISTVNGVINADFDSLQNVSEIKMDTVNGSTNLVIPSDSEATIKAESLNGSINNDFGLTVRKGKYVGRDMYGKLGSGRVKINLDAVNGATSVRRRQDGKTLSPVTNMLPAKSSDDDDDAYGPGVAPVVNTAQINREVARAVRESNRAAAESSSAAAEATREANRAAAEATREANRAAADAMRESSRATAEAMRESSRATAEALRSAQAEIARVQPEIDRATAEGLKQAAAVMKDKNVQNQIRLAQVNALKVQQEAMRNVMRMDWVNAMPTVERKTETFTVTGKPKVTVDAKNCRVTVRGWDRSDVQYSVARLSNSGVKTPLKIATNHTDSDVNIRITEPDSDDARQIRVEVYVPKKSNLRILTNQEIRVEGVSGEVDLTGGDEAINVRDVDGKLSVNSGDGMIRVIGFSGELDSHSTDGIISLEGLFQKLSAATGSGAIIVTLPDGTEANFRTESEITAQGFNLVKDNRMWRIGNSSTNYSLRTDGGEILIRNANELK